MKIISILYMLLLSIIILSFPSVVFSEMKTITGEHCNIVTGDKEKINWESERYNLRLSSIGNGLKKITDDNKVLIPGIVEDIQNNYIEKFKVVSHTERGRKICEKVQFSIDKEALQKLLIELDQKIVSTACLFGGYFEDSKFLKKYIQAEKRMISIGIIIDNKAQKVSDVENEQLADEAEKTFIECINSTEELKENVKIIERRHLNKILEEHKLSASGITDNTSLRLGKIENLDIIFLRIIYNDKKTTKLLKVETGEVLYISTDNTEVELLPNTTSRITPKTKDKK